VTAGTAITINGEFGSQCGNCTVSATPAGYTTPQALTVTSWATTAIVVQLPAALTGYLTITVDSAAGIDAIGVMAVSPSALAITPTSLQYAYTAGGALPSAQSFTITDSGSGTLAWTATASATWLSLSAASGTAPSTVAVSVAPALLSAGTYNGTVTIAATGASNSPITIAVTLVVTAAQVAPAVLVVAPQTLSFQYAVGGTVPASQSVSISNGGGGTLSWVASSSAYWATFSAASGAVPGALSVSVIAGNLAAGTYTATVTTDAGTFTIALDAKDAPKTVNSFVFLAKNHFFDCEAFMRVIPTFMDQTGSPNQSNGGTDSGPGYEFANENASPKGGYTAGEVAMANSGANTNGSQFFILVGPYNNPGYSLFGHVASGQSVVQKINADGTSAGTPLVTHRMLSVTVAES